mgnify:CR=1 FL=1
MKKKFKLSLVVFMMIASVMIGSEYQVFAVDEKETNDEQIQKDLYEEYLYNKYYYDEEKDDFSGVSTENNNINENNLIATQSQGTNETIKKLNASKLDCEYKIINLKINRVIQKTYIGAKYLYFIQRDGTTLYLSRCLLPDKGITVDASEAKMMTLNNFGHSQVLEYFEYNNVPYFWIGCKASDEIDSLQTGKSYNWSTQIARVKFEAGKTINYTEAKRLSSVSYASANGTSIGPVRRVEAALSSNKKYLLVWCRTYKIGYATENSVKKIQRSNYKTRFTIYDAEKVNDALEKSQTNYLGCNSDKIKDAYITSFTYKVGDGSLGVLRYGSNQGLEINNYKQIFVASESRKDGESQGKFIRKINSSGSVMKTIEITGNKMGEGSKTELEGLQILSGKMHFAVKDYTQTGNIHYIYNVESSVFD